MFLCSLYRKKAFTELLRVPFSVVSSKIMLTLKPISINANMLCLYCIDLYHDQTIQLLLKSVWETNCFFQRGQPSRIATDGIVEQHVHTGL